MKRIIRIGLSLAVLLGLLLGFSYGETVTSEWTNFRNSPYHIATTEAKLPEKSTNVGLKWARRFSETIDWKKAPSIPIIVDNSLIVLADKSIYKLDLRTGEILQQGEMVGNVNFGYTPLTYAQGMIFAPLNDGRIQAFDAVTLESLWLYQDDLKGQSLSPITYHDGYIYTGFWNGEENSANFVALSVKDEDTNNSLERKTARWTFQHQGGFYWCGSIVRGDTVFVGSDDGVKGSSGTSLLLSLDSRTGELKESIDVKGDIRSSISYDNSKNELFFTSKSGILYKILIDPQSNEILEVNNSVFSIESTSTPLVFNQKIYITAGSGVQKEASSGAILVFDQKDLKQSQNIQLPAYSQSTLLASIQDKEMSFYLTCNEPPGGILRVSLSDSTKPKVEQIFDATGYPEYCISSIIHDRNGNLYYKNDSGTIFAVGIIEVEDVERLIDSIVDKSSFEAAKDSFHRLDACEKEAVKNKETLFQKEAEYLSETRETAKIDAIKDEKPSNHSVVFVLIGVIGLILVFLSILLKERRRH